MGLVSKESVMLHRNVSFRISLRGSIYCIDLVNPISMGNQMVMSEIIPI